MARKAELVTSSYVAMVMDGSGKHELWVIGSNDFDYDGNFMADVANGAAVNKTITLTGATHLEDMDDLQSVRPPVYQVSIQCLEWHGAKSTTVRTYHLSDTTLNCTIGDPIANSWRRGKHGTGTIAHEVTAVFRFKKVTIEEIPPPAPVK